MNIHINPTGSVNESWFEGYIEYEGKKHKFWLVISYDTEDTSIDIRWFYKSVPKQVKEQLPQIVHYFRANVLPVSQDVWQMLKECSRVINSIRNTTINVDIKDVYTSYDFAAKLDKFLKENYKL